MVAALRRADKQRAAFAVGQRRTEHLAPGGWLHRRVFIEHQEIQAIAAQRIRLESAAGEDGSAGFEKQPHFAFERFFRPVRSRDFLEAFPENGFGLAVGRADIADILGPAVRVWGIGGAQNFGQGELGFTETAPRRDHPEPDIRVENLPLVLVERHLCRSHGRLLLLLFLVCHALRVEGGPSRFYKKYR